MITVSRLYATTKIYLFSLVKLTKMLSSKHVAITIFYLNTDSKVLEL